MEQIDWDKAPEGTTHWDASTSRINSFMKLDGDSWFYWPPASDDPKWCRWGAVTGSQDVSCMIKRPPQWTGLGIPPVGTVCEFQRYDSSWVRCEVKLIDPAGIVIKASGYLGSLHANNCHLLTFSNGGVRFRPILTPEQIAAEQREKAIAEMVYGGCGVDQSDGSTTAFVICGLLYDAGYRRFEITPE
jgi:hypothetical protein